MNYHETGYAVVSMQKPPVNSLSLEMIQALSQSLTELEKNKCKGIILTSVLIIVLHSSILTLMFL
jgi:enoyl-CoA hydratase/carnithine racemase